MLEHEIEGGGVESLDPHMHRAAILIHPVGISQADSRLDGERLAPARETLPQRRERLLERGRLGRTRRLHRPHTGNEEPHRQTQTQKAHGTFPSEASRSTPHGSILHTAARAATESALS